MANKIIFIGTSATSMGDLKASPIAPSFIGVEVHATIAAGIMDHYLPHIPAWGKGVTLFLTFVFGLSCAILFPLLGPVTTFIAALVFPGSLFLFKNWMMNNHLIVLSVIFPIIVILFLFILNIIYGYVAESRRRKEIKSSFGQYIPPEYIDIMLKKGASFELAGESKELSVLFADIRQFTNMSEKLTAPELKELLNLYLTPMTEVIFGNKGTIDKYVGDMVMAFWGAPIDDAKNAYNAVSCALGMQEKLATDVNPSFRASNRPEIHIRIGVNTGIMNVGDMGSKFRKAYTVLGDEVNLASRLEGISKYYFLDILVGENTYNITKDDFIFRPVDKVKVVGKQKAIAIYKPMCHKEKATKEILTEVEIHSSALGLLQTRQWDEAETLFTQLQKDYPQNAEFYGVYLDRIKDYRLNPPNPAWEGEVSFEHK